jgi:multiple sugar transport system ATP-binding protein
MDQTAKVSRESTNAGPLAIEIADLDKHFGGTMVLNGLHLNIERGELLVVLGDSGCGKSTLLKLIAGLDRAQTGTIRIAGAEQANVLPHKRDVAMVFQDGNGYEHLSVRQNLELAAKHSPENQLQRWVDGLRLGTNLKQKLSQLSGGELQRVAIARAMISGKSIVLLDEPLSHLNQCLREEIRDLILKVHVESKKTFVYVTHDSEEAFYLANRIAVLADGKIRQIGDPRTVYLSSNSKQVAQLLGQPTMDFIQVPRSWVKKEELPSEVVVECGLRSHDWRIQSIDSAKKDSVEFDPPKSDRTSSASNRDRRPCGLTPTDTGLTVRAWIDSCRWMGGRWLIELNCPTRIRITCESPAPDPIEQVLRIAAQASREWPRPTHFGYIEAIIPRSRLQVFDLKSC